MGLRLAPLFSLLEIHSEAVEAKKGHNILPQGYIFLWRLSSVKEFVKYFLTSKSDVFPSATGSVSKESACNMGDLGLITGLGGSPTGGHGNPHQYSCLENPHGQKSPVGFSPRGHKELDMIE